MTHRLLHETLLLSAPFLGWLIAASIGCVALALGFSMHQRMPAASRHLILALAFTVPLFAVTIFMTPIPGVMRSAFNPAPERAIVTQPTAPLPAAPSVPAARNQSELFCTLFAIWMAGASVLIVRAIQAWWRWKQIARTAVTVASDEPLPAFERTGRPWPDRVRIGRADVAAAPMVAGTFRPVIVIPAALMESLSADELSSVIAHEVEHVRRFDNAAAALHEVICALFWFDPLHWLARRRLLELRERACDESVLESGCSPDTLVSALAKTCQAAVQSPLVACMSGFRVRERMETIMSYANDRVHFVSGPVVRSLSVLAALAVVATFAFAAPAPSVPAGADTLWRFDVDGQPSGKDMYSFAVSVVSPEGELVVSSRVTTQLGLPFDMTSSDERYTYRIGVRPPVGGTAGEGTLKIVEGSKVIYTRTIPVSAPSGAERISLDLKDASLSDVLGTLAQLTGRRIIAEGVDGTITMSALNTPWDVALADAVAPLGATIEFRGRDVYIVPAPKGGSGADDRYLRLTKDSGINRPELLTRVEPVYTPEAKAARIAGIVIVEAYIDETGVVRQTRVLKPLPMGLSDAAAKAVGEWIFSPATKDGRPVPVVFNVTVNFRPAE